MGKSAHLRVAAGDGEDEAASAGEYRVLLLATLITTTRELPIKLRSLSGTGAAIEGFNLPTAGTDVILKRGPLDILATVIRVEGRRGTIQFETILSEDEIRAQIRYPRPAEPARAEIMELHRPDFDRGFDDEDRRTITG